jgi:DNA replication protein DnaC
VPGPWPSSTYAGKAVYTSQRPIALWHEAMGEPTIADALADRILAHLHRIELAGQSMRRRQAPAGADDKDQAAGEASRPGRS